MTGPPRGPSLAFWRSLAMFEGADEATLAALARACTRQGWSAGAVLFQRGDLGTTLVALVSGRVKLSVATPDGRELSFAHAEAGDILGEMALLDEAPRSADATALEPTIGWVLSRPGFQDLAARHPDLWPSVARFLCRRLRDTNETLESIALYGLEARLARFLLFTLRTIHGDDPPPRAALRLALSQSELAAMLGASRPKVNRALQHLSETGALRRQGDLLDCDLAALRAAAEPQGG